MTPRLFYIGNLGPDAAPFSTENDVRRGFEAIGWDVDGMPETYFLRQVARGNLTEVKARAAVADLVLWTATQGRTPDDDRVRALWSHLREVGVPTAAFHLDRYYDLASPKGDGPQRHELPVYHPMFRMDWVFTADGGHQAEFQRDAVNHVWLPPAVRYDEARDIEPTEEDLQRWEGIDVAFVGSWQHYHAEWPHRRELVEHLRAWYGDSFVCVGGDSPAGPLRGEALNRFYATVPVCVGDSCLVDADAAYWSDRVPETWGRGGFLVHPHVAAMDQLLGPHLPGAGWTPGDWGALHLELEMWLANPGMREQRRQDVAAKVRGQHTYLRRAEEIVEHVFS